MQARGLDGGPFDRSANDLFQVHSSGEEPADAAVKVFYRNTWFYISETDVDSKTTFSLMSMLLMLQGGDPARMSPLVSVSPG